MQKHVLWHPSLIGRRGLKLVLGLSLLLLCLAIVGGVNAGWAETLVVSAAEPDTDSDSDANADADGVFSSSAGECLPVGLISLPITPSADTPWERLIHQGPSFSCKAAQAAPSLFSRPPPTLA